MFESPAAARPYLCKMDAAWGAEGSLSGLQQALVAPGEEHYCHCSVGENLLKEFDLPVVYRQVADVACDMAIEQGDVSNLVLHATQVPLRTRS